MVLGMSLSTFTMVHVVLSLVGILAGAVVVAGMLGSRTLPGWTGVFLATTILTSVTGFMFPFTQIGPPHVVGAISLVLLAIALVALYGRHLHGSWRWVYVGTAIASLYLNVFVGVVQAFQKILFLNPLAPTQTEPPFIVTQLAVLALFVVLAIAATLRFRPDDRYQQGGSG